MAVINGSFANGSKNTHPWLDYTYTQDIGNNSSTITVKLYMKKDTSYAQSVQTSSVWIKIDGTTAWSNSAFKIDIRPVAVGSSQYIGTATKTIYHNSDGTKSINIAGYIGTTAISLGAGNVSGTVYFNTIPRKTNVSISGDNKFGGSMTINHAGASTSFRHNVKYYFGNTSGTIASNTSENSTKWTIPKSLQSQIPDATSGSIRIVLETVSNGSVIGTSETWKTIYVADDCRPTVSSGSFSDGVTKPSGVTGYYQNFSKLKTTISASGVYGSWITQYKLWVDGVYYTSTSSTVVSGILRNSGEKDVWLYAKDSRGYEVNKVYYGGITVTPYTAPTISSFAYKRTVIEDGIEQPSNMGNIGYFSASGTFNASSKNQVRRFKYKTKSGSTWTLVDLSNQNYTDYKFSSSLSTADAYLLIFEMNDMLQTVYKEIEMVNIFPLISMNPQGNGLAFGKEATTQKIIDIDMDVYIHGKKMEAFDKENIPDGIRFTGYGEAGRIGKGQNDVYIKNEVSSKFIQMKDNGWLQYQEKLAVGRGGEALRIMGAESTCYMTFYPTMYDCDGSQPRYGWFGYGSPGSSEMTVTNSYGDLNLVANNVKMNGSTILNSSNHPSPRPLWSGNVTNNGGSITLTDAAKFNWIAIYAKPSGASGWVSGFFVYHMYYTANTSNQMQIADNTNYIIFAMYQSGNDVIVTKKSGSGGIQYIYGGY